MAKALSDRSASQLTLDLMFAALRVHDETLNELALELFGRFGEPTVRRLVLEACNHKNNPAYRLRMLRALERIGAIADPMSMMDLWMLLHDRNQQIREAASALIASRRLCS